ncbi:MAG TPA: hypothetical protein VK956_04485 [Verrucomicrobium sp.]|nr:hypothetical protein [Verrucomicrobium sp.]
MLQVDDDLLKERLATLSDSDKFAAARYLFDTWEPKHRDELEEVLESMGLPLHQVILQWAQVDFEKVFQRTEMFEGFHRHDLRVPLVSLMAQRNPLEAAEFVGTRFNAMSRSHYYYVVTEGLVPCLAKLPVSELMTAFRAIASGEETMDRFRWKDSIYILMRGKEAPWVSPDLDADWKYIVAQKPGTLRDLLLGLVLERRLERDLETAITTNVASPQADPDELKLIVWDALPADPSLVVKLLPKADPHLMSFWMAELMERGPAPDWPAWAAQVLALKPESLREQALEQFTRLWALHDESAARQWSDKLPAGSRDRAVTELQVQSSRIVKQAQENWTRAFEAASALPESEVRQTTLLAVFKAGINCDLAEIEACSQSVTKDPALRIRLLDVWTLGRLEDVAKSGNRHKEIYPLVLRLKDPVLRARKAEDYRPTGRFAGFAELRKAVENSALSDEEKHAFLQGCTTDEVDGLMTGYRIPSEAGGSRDAMQATLRIADPRIRFVMQRFVIHDTAEDDIQAARKLIEETKLDPESRKVLMQEWERISKWLPSGK